MKRITNITKAILFGILGVVCMSCDNISEEDRYLKEEIPVSDNPRTLFILEFTGTNCRNCPDGAEALHGIIETRPGQVVVVGAQPEGNVNTRPVNGFELTCPQATVFYNYFAPAGFPCAVFDGTVSSTATLTWLTKAADALKVPAKMNISVTTDYNAETRELTASYELDFSNKIEGSLSVQLLLTEDNIEGWQNKYGKKVEYTHQHVLRASLNGEWGENIGNAFYPGDKIDGTASITLDEGWDAANCNVVAYVFHNDGKAVEQAAQVAIFPSATE